MAKDSNTLVRLATNKPKMFLVVEVTYSKGGLNYFSGGTDRRGYSIVVRPIEDDGSGCIRWIIGRGALAFVQEAKRFNPSELARISNRALSIPAYGGGSLVKKLLDSVAAHEELIVSPVAWLDALNQASESLVTCA